MTFFSLILALVLEQLRPLPARGWTVRVVRGVVGGMRGRFEGGSAPASGSGEAFAPGIAANVSVRVGSSQVMRIWKKSTAPS